MAQDLNATVKKVTLTDTKGKKHMLTGNNPEAQINTIRIYESIELNTIAAELQIIDTAINLIGSTPIVGTETVEIEMVAPNISDTTYKWKFVVYGIRNRLVSKNVQVYILDLFSPEALRNETLRVGKTIAGTGDAIVQEILSNYLDTDKEIITEPCKYRMKQIPALKRPFDVISSFLPECVSSSTNTPLAPQSSSTSSGGGSSSASGGSTQAATKNSATVISGTAGYMFFETYDGYVFKSIDALIKENQNKHREYIYGFAQGEGQMQKKIHI